MMKAPKLTELFKTIRGFKFNAQTEEFEPEDEEVGYISNVPFDGEDYTQETPKKNTVHKVYDEYTVDERALFQEQYEQMLKEGNFKYGRFTKKLSGKELAKDFLIGGALYKMIKDGEGIEHPVFASRFNAYTNTVTFSRSTELDQETLKIAFLSIMKEGKRPFYLNRTIKAPETIADQQAYFAAAYKAAMSLNIPHDEIKLPRKFAAFKEHLRQESKISTEKPDSSYDEDLSNHPALNDEAPSEKPESQIKEIIQHKPENEAKEKAELSIKENPNHMFLFRTRDDDNGEPKYLAFLTPESKDDLESMKKGFAHIVKDQPELIPQIKGVYRAAGYEENLQDILKKEDNCLEGYKLLKDIQNGVVKATAKPAKEMIDETNIVPIKKPETDNLKPKESEPKPKTRSTPKPKR